MTALIVYYSLSGTARAVAEALAKDLSADVEEIRCARYTRGVMGFMRAAYDSWRGNLPEVEPLSRDLARYDLVVIGGPIWAFHPSTPVRAFLKREARRLPGVAFFLTHGGSAGPESLHELEQIAGRAPRATLTVRQTEVEHGAFHAKVAGFATALRAEKAA